MKKALFIPSLFVALAVAPAFAQSVNPFQTIDGTVTLKGLGTENRIAYSDVKVSLKFGTQASGPRVVGPTLTNPVVAVDGLANKVGKLTNKEILIAAGLNPQGLKIRWARVGNVPFFQAYNANGPVAVIPASILAADVSWARDYSGVYGGGADLSATSTTSGTSVFVSEGALSGLTSMSGEALDYIPFSGVGKFSTDSSKQLSATIRIGGIGQAP